MIELSQLKDRKPFGQELLEKGVISQEELATALSLQNQSADRIGKLFIDIGAISEADLTAHLSAYLGIPYLKAEDLPEVPVLEGTFSASFMRECKFIPVSQEEERGLVLAMANPQDYATLDTIRIYTGYQNLQVFLAPENAVLDLIEKFYGTQTSTLDRIVEDIEGGMDMLSEEMEDVEHLKDLASEAPVIRLVNLIMSRAIESRASDIHIEPFERDLKVRYRVDGVLYYE